MTSTGTGSAPPLMRTASWSASSWLKLPVIWVVPPWMPTLHADAVCTCGELMTWPSSTIATRRSVSPLGLQAAWPVRVSHLRPPSPWKSTETKRCVPVVGSTPAVASPTSSPVSAAGPSMIGSAASSYDGLLLAGVELRLLVLRAGRGRRAGSGGRGRSRSRGGRGGRRPVWQRPGRPRAARSAGGCGRRRRSARARFRRPTERRSRRCWGRCWRARRRRPARRSAPPSAGARAPARAVGPTTCDGSPERAPGGRSAGRSARWRRPRRRRPARRAARR